MGTVSDPGGVSIPPGWDPSVISGLESAYDTAKSNLDDKKTDAENARTHLNGLGATVISTRDAYNALVDAGAPQSEIDDAYDAYTDALNAFNTYRTNTLTPRWDAYDAALDATMAAAVAYATAAARQQLSTLGSSQTDIDAWINAAVNLGTPGYSATFEWLTEQVKIALRGDPSDPSDTGAIGERAQAADTLIDAFNAYRYREYLVATARVAHQHARYVFLTAHYNWIANPSTANETARSLALSSLNTAGAAITSAINGPPSRTSIRNDLTAAINAFQTIFLEANDPLVAVIGAVRTYVDNYDDVLQQIRDETDTALTESREAAELFDQQRHAEHVSALPDVNVDVTRTAIEEAVAAAMLQFSGISSRVHGREDVASDIPQLPPGTVSLSMNQLMKLLSQVQLMLQELLRKTADADRFMKAIRLRFAVQDLEFYLSYLQATDLWNQQILAADAQYDLTVEEYNIRHYDNFVDPYSVWYDNPEIINGVIDDINADIAAYNSSVESLVDYANDIEQSAIDAINANREDYPHAATIFSFLYPADAIGSQTLLGDATPVEPPDPIPPFDNISPSDLPELPYADGNLPVGEVFQEDIESGKISDFNDDLQEFLVEVSPYFPQIISALSAHTGIGESELGITPLYFRQMLGVRDNRDRLAVYENIAVLLYGALTQIALLEKVSEETSPEDIQKLINEIAKLFSTTSDVALRESLFSPGVSFILGVGGGPAGAVGRAINLIMRSETYTRDLEAIIEKIGIFAGLQAAGILPAVLQTPSLLGVPITEILHEQGINIADLIEEQNTRTLLFAYVEQLAIASTQIDSLRQDALALLGQFPELSSLSEAEIQELVEFLVAMQQIMFLLLAVLMGLRGGVSVGALMASVFGPAAGGETDLALQFEALGLPQARARELAAQVAGLDRLQTLLADLGLNPQTTTILLALMAAARGGISLTEGIPGGAAFYSALVEKLAEAGIVITADISSPEFFNELLSQLQALATTDEQKALLGHLLGPSFVAPLASPLGTRLSDYLEQFPTEVAGIFGTPLVPPTLPDPIAPSFVIGQITAQFDLLPEEIQADIIAIAEGMPGFEGVSAEEKAALLLAIRTGAVSPGDATLLLTLYDRELQGTLSDSETELIRRLFAPSEEQIQRRQEDLQSDILRPHERPSTVPIQTLERLRGAFSALFRDSGDAEFAREVFERFANTVENLSDFNSVVLDLLLDPGRNILKNFSIISRSGYDNREQPQIFFGG